MSKCRRVTGAAIGVLLASATWAVEESRLWLPASFKEQLQQPLADAAALSAHETRCEEVLEGRLASRRHEGRPLLTIICRDRATRRSYYRNYAVSDSGELEFIASNLPQAPADYLLPLETLERLDQETDPAAQAQPHAAQPEPEPEPEQEPAASEPPQAPVAPTPAEVAWSTCYSTLLERAHRMHDVVVPDQPPAAEVREDGGWRYRIPFLARNSRGQQLHYLGHCQVDAEGHAEFTISVQLGE